MKEDQGRSSNRRYGFLKAGYRSEDPKRWFEKVALLRSTMDTSRVDIVYRPLRIVWVVKGQDFWAFRRIARLSCTIAGGRYNPIVSIDAPEATQIVESFRPDLIRSVGEAPEINAFVNRFPHLIDPWIGSGELHYEKGIARGGGCHVLDIHNLLSHRHQERDWRDISNVGFRRFLWDDADPLSDVFLTELGSFPPVTDVYTDYLSLFSNAALPEPVIDIQIASQVPIPEDVAKYPSLSFMGRFGIREYPLSDRSYWNQPGFYSGRADNFEDLVGFWNLRAAGMAIHFVDSRYVERYALTLPIYREALKQRIPTRDDSEQRVAVWAREQPTDERASEALAIVGDARPLICTLSENSWNGLNIRPPTMMLGEASTLGVVVSKRKRNAATFALADKPFSGDVWFYQQKVVASVSMFRSREDDDATFQLPWVPELNEYYGRSTGVGFAELRVEPGRTGIVINVSADDATIYAVPTTELLQELFKTCGMGATLSNAGLITRQLIAQMNGLGSTRAFKIPGVRRLIRTSGINKSVTRKEAVEIIGKRDPLTGATFSEHKNLFIEQRPINSELRPADVFSHLVEKRIFRVGTDLLCPTCRLSSWFAIDDIKQNVACTYCGADIDTVRRLSTEPPLSFRRSGLLGIERNMQGAIPVIMVLQQLMNSVLSVLHGGGAVYMPSMNVDALNGSWTEPRELDFVALELTRNGAMTRPKRTSVVIGEVKDQGSNIDANDAETMRRIAVAFPRERFKVFIVFAKLNAFNDAELAVAAMLSRDHDVALLTHKELEPYDIYHHSDETLSRHLHGLEGLIQFTHARYPALRPQSLHEP